MFSTERFRVWFQRFSGERAARIKAELQARHAKGPEVYLSDKHPPLPRPRFDVRVGDNPGGNNIGRRRPHRRTNKRPSGRPSKGRDVYLGRKVVEDMQTEGLTETAAIARVTDTLGRFNGWDDPTAPWRDARRAARNSARDRVYRSLGRYREYLKADKNIARIFESAAAVAG